MRYVDTGSRNPNEALGAWLEEIIDDLSVIAVRWQSGFFSGEALGYFVDIMTRLKSVDGTLSILIGSNEGVTRRVDVERLLDVIGPARPAAQIGVVSFENAYFHPKTFHFTRADGSEAAYVGSANLTGSGAASLHVEAGVVLDSGEGDDAEVLARIRDAIDWWFDADPPGLHLVTDATSLESLVEARVLDVPRPVLATPLPANHHQPSNAARLHRLRILPPVGASKPLPHPVVDPEVAESEVVVVAEWAKKLSQSDAQRKPVGHQRGSITLVTAGYPIKAQTYFRHDFFGVVEWVSETTRTGVLREQALVGMDVSVLGESLGFVTMLVTHAPNRESAQANYTTLLHLGSLAGKFVENDLTGRRLHLRRRSDTSFELSID